MLDQVIVFLASGHKEIYCSHSKTNLVRLDREKLVLKLAYDVQVLLAQRISKH